MSLPKTQIKIYALAVSAALASLGAHASGYHFGFQSVTALSTANASAAEAVGPSTIFHNPAGLTEVEGTQVTSNLFLIVPNAKYSDAKATYNPEDDGAPVTTGSTSPTGETSGKIAHGVTPVPSLYASHQLNDNVTLGFGIYVPFAAETDYGDQSVLRYNLNETSVKSFDFNPTLAFKINDQHSVGVGLIAQYFDAKLVKYADYTGTARYMMAKGMSDAGLFPDYNTARNVVNTMVPHGKADARGTIKGDDWGFGYNLGYLWKPNDNFRLGVSYRSKVSHTLKGHVDWDLVGTYFTNPPPTVKNIANVMVPLIHAPVGSMDYAMGYIQHEGVNVKIATPESLSLHTMWKATPKWNLFGNLTWTRHSRLNKIAVKLDSLKIVENKIVNGVPEPFPLDTATMQTNWRNTYMLALGASYQWNEALQLRFGAHYDRTPVRSNDTRLPTMPDNDRIMLAAGARYDVNKNHTINAAYGYMRVRDAQFTVQSQRPNIDNYVVGTAKTKTSAHILGLQYTYKF